MGHGTRARNQRLRARAGRLAARPVCEPEILYHSMLCSAVPIAARPPGLVPAVADVPESRRANAERNRHGKIRVESTARRFREGRQASRSEPARPRGLASGECLMVGTARCAVRRCFTLHAGRRSAASLPKQKQRRSFDRRRSFRQPNLLLLLLERVAHFLAGFAHVFTRLFYGIVFLLLRRREDRADLRLDVLANRLALLSGLLARRLNLRLRLFKNGFDLRLLVRSEIQGPGQTFDGISPLLLPAVRPVIIFCRGVLR